MVVKTRRKYGGYRKTRKLRGGSGRGASASGPKLLKRTKSDDKNQEHRDPGVVSFDGKISQAAFLAAAKKSINIDIKRAIQEINGLRQVDEGHVADRDRQIAFIRIFTAYLIYRGVSVDSAVEFARALYDLGASATNVVFNAPGYTGFATLSDYFADAWDILKDPAWVTSFLALGTTCFRFFIPSAKKNKKSLSEKLENLNRLITEGFETAYNSGQHVLEATAGSVMQFRMDPVGSVGAACVAAGDFYLKHEKKIPVTGPAILQAGRMYEISSAAFQEKIKSLQRAITASEELERTIQGLIDSQTITSGQLSRTYTQYQEFLNGNGIDATFFLYLINVMINRGSAISGSRKVRGMLMGLSDEERARLGRKTSADATYNPELSENYSSTDTAYGPGALQKRRRVEEAKQKIKGYDADLKQQERKQQEKRAKRLAEIQRKKKQKGSEAGASAAAGLPPTNLPCGPYPTWGGLYPRVFWSTKKPRRRIKKKEKKKKIKKR